MKEKFMDKEMIIDAPTMRMAIALTVKKNVEVLFKKAESMTDLGEAAQCYREVATEMERGHMQLQKLEKEVQDDAK